MIARIAVGALAANCWILPIGSDGSCLLVDPGAEADRILGFLDGHRLVPSLVVCTHGHFDHVCAIGPLREVYASRGIALPVAIHRDDSGYLGDGGEARNRRLLESMGGDYFDGLWTPVPQADILLEEGSTLPDTSWFVIHTPGHSKGSICLYDETRGLLVSGDTLFRDGVGRTDGFDGSAEELRQSIVSKLFPLPSETKVFPGHGARTTIGRERGY